MLRLWLLPLIPTGLHFCVAHPSQGAGSDWQRYDASVDPLSLFLAVTGLAVALAFVCRIRHRRVLTAVNLLLALFSATLVAFELATRAQAHPANIRVDLLVTIPALSVCALVIGLLTSRWTSGVGRGIAVLMAVIAGTALAWFGWRFVRSSRESAEWMRRHDAGSRLYWEETIRCQEAMSARFGGLNRKDNACSGNLRVKTRVGTYPFTRVVVNDASEVYLLAAIQPGAESVFTARDRPMHGLFDPSTRRWTASNWDGASKIELELLAREDGSCEARIDRGGYGRDVLRLEREELRACPADNNPPVEFVGAWNKVEPFGPESFRLVQIWLWRSQNTAWGLVFRSEGVRGIETGLSFLKRYKGKVTGAHEYQLLPYSKLDGSDELAISVSAEGARIEGLSGVPEQGLLLGGGEQVSHSKVRLVPLRDRDRFAAYFDTVLDLVDVPWTPR